MKTNQAQPDKAQVLTKAQSMKYDNPFMSDDEISDDDQPQNIEETITIIKPYEEHFQKFCNWYNQFITQTISFEDERNLPHNNTEFSIFHINMMEIEQQIGLFDIIISNNKDLNKITQIFSHLRQEVDIIKETFEKKFFNSLALYGQHAQENEDEEYILKDGQAEVEFSKLCSVLKQIYDQTKKIISIVYIIINQIGILFNKKDNKYYSKFQNVNFFQPLDIIGDALGIVYILDCIVQDNETLNNHWNFFKKMEKIISTEPDKYQTDKRNLRHVEKYLVKLENSILSKKCFQQLITLQKWDDLMASQVSDHTVRQSGRVQLSKNKELHQLFQNYFKYKIQYLSDAVGNPAELNEKNDMLSLLCVYAFYRVINNSEEDKNIYKALWSMQKKIPYIVGHNHVLCYTYKFLYEICPLTKKTTLEPKEPIAIIDQYDQQIDQSLEVTIQMNYGSFCSWISRMESNITSNTYFTEIDKYKKETQIQHIEERLNQRIKLLRDAQIMAYQVRNLLEVFVISHVIHEKSLDPIQVKAIKIGLEMLKGIEHYINSKSDSFNPTLLNKYLYKQVSPILLAALDRNIRLDQQQRKNGESSEITTAIQMMLKIMRGPVTPLKCTILDFLQQIVFQKGVVTQEEQDRVQNVLAKMKYICQFQYEMKEATNCQFFYWTRQLFPSMLQDYIASPISVNRIQFLIRAIQDSEILINNIVHLEDNNQFITYFKDSILRQLNEEFITPIIQHIDMYLRINIHSILLEKMKANNPFENTEQEINRYLSINFLYVFDKIIDLKSEITKCLNEKFYNMNTLNMHDQETYEQMRSLANFKFGLNLMHVFLPSQTINQGQQDILSIIRNIPEFITKYTYNLYTQTFVEITGQSKQIFTVGIQQITDSIRTHGMGILNTTVNSVYKFLRSHIENFSKFLYDDQIQSPIRIEHKFFTEHTQELDGKYPYDHAEKIYKEIKRLGTFENDYTLMDKFRCLMTEVGNSLGFVRLLRSASLNYISQTVEFMPPNLQVDEKFADMAKTANMGEITIQTCQELDDIFTSLSTSFSKKTDYLKVLVKQFQKVIKSPQNKHLDYFYIILPAVSINYVEHILMAKERLAKSNPHEAFFFDDGFILGMSYFLKLTEQFEAFNSLHWQDEIKKYFDKHIDEVKQLVGKTTTNRRGIENVNMEKGLSLKQLTQKIDEYDQIFYSFNSASILFKEA